MVQGTNESIDRPIEPVAILNYVDPNAYKIKMIVWMGGIATFLKHGIVVLLLGLEILYSKFNNKRILEEVEKHTFSVLTYQKSQSSLLYVFFLSFILCVISCLSFLFLLKKCRSIEKLSILQYTKRLLMILTIETTVGMLNNILRIKTYREDIEKLFAFRETDFVGCLFYYYILYFPNTQYFKITMPFFVFRLLSDIHSAFCVDIEEVIKGTSCFDKKYFSEEVSNILLDICKKCQIQENRVLVPSSKFFDNAKTIIKRKGYYYIPTYVIDNYNEKGLIGCFLLASKCFSSNDTIFSIACIFNFLVLFAMIKLFLMSYELRSQALVVMCSIKITNFMEFLTTLFINRAQRSVELGVDKNIARIGYEQYLLEYFVERSSLTGQVENVHFSEILALLSPSNSLVARINNIRSIITKTE